MDSDVYREKQELQGSPCDEEKESWSSYVNYLLKINCIVLLIKTICYWPKTREEASVTKGNHSARDSHTHLQ